MNKKFIENIYKKIYMKISQMNKKFIKKKKRELKVLGVVLQ